MVVLTRRPPSRASKIGRQPFRCCMADSAGGGGKAVIKRPKRAADAQRHHLDFRPGGAVQSDDLPRCLECRRGIARVYGQERFFAKRTIGKARISSYGAGQAYAPDTA